MKFKTLAIGLILAASLHVAMAQSTGPQLTVIQYNSNINPCQSASVVKSSAVVNIGSATTAVLVPAVTGKTTYLCGFTASVVGTTPTLLFKTGTQASAACDTSTASISGTFAPTSGSMVTLNGPGTIMQTIASGQLCATAGGTTPSIQGVLTYVQQ